MNANNRYTTITDSINYDYPTCGGLIIGANDANYRIEARSNYQGSITGRVVTVPRSAVQGALDEEMACEIIRNAEALAALGGRVIRRGYRVQ